MGLIRKILGLEPKVNCHEMIANGAILIDVRTPKEYASSRALESENVPLDKLKNELERIKKWNKPIVLCCASGVRSGRATAILKSKGIEAYNGGAWHKFS